MFKLNENNSKNYTLVDEYEIPEQNIEVVELLHTKTEAKIILFICNDENRVFNIAFKTPVENNKGIQHILEHSVLCGSKKYNVKDPFIELAKGSMNTFLNAMTFPDKTCYPVASANLKDFHNLVSVYLDAVFYPNAISNDKIFKQEGWHYEINSIEDELSVNGVVYNEMKGVYSDPDSILESAVLKNIFSGTNYEYEYGGMPNEIYNLSFKEFCDFHKKYYSPSNSIVYYYGKLDYNYELESLDNKYFGNFEKINVDVNFKSVSNFIKNNEQIDYYSIDSKDNTDKAYIAYTFAIDGEKTGLKNILIQIIDYVLFSSKSAILKEKFLKEGLGEVVFSRYDMGLKDGIYSIISQNISENKKNDFVRLFDESIREIIESGLDIDKFKAGINSTYFDYAEDEYASMPKGLYLTLLSLDTYLYGDGVRAFLEYKNAFDIINNEDLSKNDNIFINILKELFVDNKHRCINILRPKMEYSKEKEKIIFDELRDRKSKLSEIEIKNIIKDVRELKEFQSVKDSDEDLRCIPTIKLGDIDKSKKTIDFEIENNDNVYTIISYKNDKDIVYIDLKFDITDFSKEELYFTSLVTNLLSKTDLISQSYSEFNNYVDVNTGGLSIGYTIADDKALASYGIKVAKDKVGYAFDIFYKLLSESQFIDSNRINILLNECKQNSLLSILSSGHLSAINRSKSTFDFASSVFDKVFLNGISFYKFISSVTSNYIANCDLINDTLSLVYKKILLKKMYFTLCINKEYYSDVIDYFKSFSNNITNYNLKHLYSENDENRLSDNIQKIKRFIDFDAFEKKCRSEAIFTPNDINFCALSGRFSPDLYSGGLSVIKTLFNYEYLWTNIRVLGGAYGCTSTFSRVGNYSLCSYRDPNLSKTNKVYIGVPKFLQSFDASDEEINKFIIGTMGSFDNPVSIVEHYKRNIGAYFNNISDEKYNERRKEALNLTANDIRKMSRVFEGIDNADYCALISSSKIEEAKDSYEHVWQLIE